MFTICYVCMYVCMDKVICHLHISVVTMASQFPFDLFPCVTIVTKVLVDHYH